jgi:hypothetical protein
MRHYGNLFRLTVNHRNKQSFRINDAKGTIKYDSTGMKYGKQFKTFSRNTAINSYSSEYNFFKSNITSQQSLI